MQKKGMKSLGFLLRMFPIIGVLFKIILVQFLANIQKKKNEIV